MKFGIRECCDVVFRAKAKQQIGNKYFFRNEPVIYFDTLKTSSMEGAANTVYATGGRGNPQLMAWEGERTLKFTMEDALISPEGLNILTGAGLIEASATKPMYVHKTIVIEAKKDGNFKYISTDAGYSIEITNLELIDEKEKSHTPFYGKTDFGFYVMPLDSNGEVLCEPLSSLSTSDNGKLYWDDNVIKTTSPTQGISFLEDSIKSFLVDFYEEYTSNGFVIDIEPNKFGGYYYIEASTLFRDQATGVDMPAEFIIPKGKVQSNFTFTMAGSGDPSTFTFTVDAFPDYTKYDSTKKVLASIQVLKTDDGSDPDAERDATRHIDSSSSSTLFIEGPDVISEAGEGIFYHAYNTTGDTITWNKTGGTGVSISDFAAGSTYGVKVASLPTDDDVTLTLTVGDGTSSAEKLVTIKKASST